MKIIENIRKIGRVCQEIGKIMFEIIETILHRKIVFTNNVMFMVVSSVYFKSWFIYIKIFGTQENLNISYTVI